MPDPIEPPTIDPPITIPNNKEPKPEPEPSGEMPPSFDAWITEQQPEIRTMLDDQFRGLRSALDKERKQSKVFEKELRDAARKLDDTDQMKSQLTGLADQLSEIQREKVFYAAAHKAGTNNLPLAYLAAKTDNLVDDDGEADFDRLKQNYPQLFAADPVRVPKGNAGDGTHPKTPQTSIGMNDFIRQAAGRSP